MYEKKTVWDFETVTVGLYKIFDVKIFKLVNKIKNSTLRKTKQSLRQGFLKLKVIILRNYNSFENVIFFETFCVYL